MCAQAGPGQLRLTRSNLTHLSETRRSRKTGTHPLGGFVGEAVYEGDAAPFLSLLRVAEITGIGRQTVWGKGEIRVMLIGFGSAHVGSQAIQFESHVMPYLLKTEPDAYSFSDLERDNETVWDGVTNPVAIKNLRGMKPGDDLVIYHTGDERRAVGTRICHQSRSRRPKESKDLHPCGKTYSTAATRAEVKASSLFENSPLVKQGRLSGVPLPPPNFPG